jgi:hypothetical protein
VDRFAAVIQACKAAQDSTGGVVTCVCRNVPVGWGEPCFDKLEAVLAHAMMSIPATKVSPTGSGTLGFPPVFNGGRGRGGDGSAISLFCHFGGRALRLAVALRAHA